LPLFGNHWTLAADHRIRLDLTQVDYPTFLPSNSLGAILTFPGAQLVLPTREAGDLTIPGAGNYLSQARARGGSRPSTAAVARRRSKALQMPKSRTIGTELRASTAKPAASASAEAATAGPTLREATRAASAGSMPAARSLR